MQAQALRPRDRQEDRAAGDPGEERGLPLDREVLLAAEPAAGGHLGDPHARLGKGEHVGDLAPVLPDALPLGEDLQLGRAVPRSGHRQAGFRLEEGVLDRARREAVAHDVGRGRQGSRRVAPPDHGGVKQIARRMDGRGTGLERRERVGDRRQNLILDIDQGGRRAGLAARPGRHRGKHVADVAGGLAFGDEDGPVARDQPDAPLAGDVGRGHDRHDPGSRNRTGRVDAADDRPGVVREAKRAVHHPRCGHVVHERPVAEGELAGVPADGARPDPAAPLDLRTWLAAASGGDHLDRVDDLHVARAAAQVPGERPRDHFSGGRGLALEQRRGPS